MSYPYLPVSDSRSYDANILVGVVTATTIPATEGRFTNLVLDTSVTTPTFVAVNERCNLESNKAYLQIDTRIFNDQSAEIVIQEVGEGTLGDINKDGQVNITDITTLVNMILGLKYE